MVESDPLPFPPKSALELAERTDLVETTLVEVVILVLVTGEVTSCDLLDTIEDVETVLVEDVEAPIISPDPFFLGETTLATLISLFPTLSSVISSNSKLGSLCGDSILLCLGVIFGRGVRGRSSVSRRSAGAGKGLTGESVLNSSE